MNAYQRRGITFSLILCSLLFAGVCSAQVGSIGKKEFNEHSHKVYCLLDIKGEQDRINSAYKQRIIHWHFPLSKNLFGYSYPMSDTGHYVFQGSYSSSNSRLAPWSIPHLYHLTPRASSADFEFSLSEEPTLKMLSTTQLHIVVPEEGKRIINTSFNWIIPNNDKVETNYWFLLAN